MSDEELALAIERVIREGYGMDRKDIPAAACRLLGFPRVSDEMRQRVGAVLERLRGIRPPRGAGRAADLCRFVIVILQ